MMVMTVCDDEGWCGGEDREEEEECLEPCKRRFD